MAALSGFPIELSLEEALKKLKLDAIRAERLGANQLFETARSLIHPRALYAPASITGRSGDTITVGRADFTSRILAKNLEGAERVFPYIITIGEALENEARASRNVAGQLLLDELGNSALDSSVKYLESCVSEEYGLRVISNMSPGQLDWSIDQQRQLFSIFNDVENAIGVKLTDSMLMVPRKSVSGIMFPTDVLFVSCQLCQRENCTSRKVAYDEQAHREYVEGADRRPTNGTECL